MKKKILILIFSLIIIFTIITSVFLIMKNESKSIILKSLYNTDNILYKNSYKNIIDINIKSKINDKNIENRIKNIYIKNNKKYKIDTKQYTNNTLINTSINYIEKKGNNYDFYYYLGNRLQKQEIDNLDSKIKFSFKYSDLKNIIKNYNYIGKVKYNNKKLNKYSVDVKEYEIYNFLYSNNILTKKNSNKNTKLYLYIDSKSDIIYKMYFDIKNVKDDNQNIEYNVSIDNTNIGKVNEIKIPNK